MEYWKYWKLDILNSTLGIGLEVVCTSLEVRFDVKYSRSTLEIGFDTNTNIVEVHWKLMALLVLRDEAHSTLAYSYRLS